MSDPSQAAPKPQAIVNIGAIISGDWRAPLVEGDTIVAEDGLIRFVGAGAGQLVAKADVVIDAAGATAIPGLIDSSLTDMPAEWFICASTGSNARIYRLNAGFLQPGKDADIAPIDARAGGAKEDALSALKNGDVPAGLAVVGGGVRRFVGLSRNTPAGIRTVRVAVSRAVKDFARVGKRSGDGWKILVSATIRSKMPCL